MISFEEFDRLTQIAVEEMPPCFLEELNGGVILAEEAKLHPVSVDNPLLYIMGEYHSDSTMGKMIYLYYGSFMASYSYMDSDNILKEIRKVVRHEFRHHMETRAGERDLIIEDEKEIDDYIKKNCN